jgi:uncharacterized membrane protein YfhO
MDAAPKYVSEIGDKTFYRYDENTYGGQGDILNSSILNKQNSANFYHSILSKNIGQFRIELDLQRSTQDFVYRGVDNSAILETLINAKYFVVKRGLEQYISYGFSKKVYEYKDNSGAMYDIYEADNVLPLGYTYSSYIPREQYEQLSVNQKQQSLLQGVIVDEETAEIKENLVLAEPSFQDKNINYTVECKSGVEYDGEKFVVKKASAQIILSFEGISNTETYLNIKNLWFNPVSPKDNYSEEEWDKLPLISKTKLTEQAKYWVAPQNSNITAVSGNISKTQAYTTPKHVYYTNKHDYSFNMGYSEAAKTQITLSFNQVGEYTFDSLNIICQPLEFLSGQVSALKEDVLEDVVISDNLVTGNIKLEQSKLLCMSIPYGEGWTAYVNGEPAELLRVNTMYSGLLLEPGTYEIELHYFTPGLKIGIIFSIAGILALICIVVYFQLIRPRKKVRVDN